MTMAGAPAPSLDVIVVNYRTGPLVIGCLDSLSHERERMPGLRAIIVDNASGDGSARQIADAIASRGWHWATLIESPVNGGFGAGNNFGLQYARTRDEPADLFWLLNPDTVVRPGAALALAQFMAAHPAAGIAGSMLLEADGAPWPFAFRFPSILGEFERGARLGVVTRLLRNRAVLRPMGQAPERADWVSGASFVVRRAMLEQGLAFDERFFLYYEETDLCLRAARAGWECWYVPAAVVLHIAGQSTGVTGAQAAPKRLPLYWFQSRRRYLVKNHGSLYTAFADIAWMAGHLLFVTRSWLGKKQRTDPPHLATDFLQSSVLFPGRAWQRGGRTGALS
ncbi:glycosyltransferase family 2 protein [Sphingomonas sp. IW22]|uniref:glycosyltransferase family 2 protein n=1 Tax=Sphingomonas sp. IW22 TaxID=3242489 RepID=UPI00352226E4